MMLVHKFLFKYCCITPCQFNPVEEGLLLTPGQIFLKNLRALLNKKWEKGLDKKIQGFILTPQRLLKLFNFK